MALIVAFLTSPEDPTAALEAFAELAALTRELGGWVRCDHASPAALAAEAAAANRALVYLARPQLVRRWGRLWAPREQVMCMNQGDRRRHAVPHVWALERCRELVKKIHPDGFDPEREDVDQVAHQLIEGGGKLERPATAAIVWKMGKVGGVGQGLRVARALGVPVHDVEGLGVAVVASRLRDLAGGDTLDP